MRQTLPQAMRDLDRVVAQASIFGEVLIIGPAMTGRSTPPRAADKYPNLHIRTSRAVSAPAELRWAAPYGMAHRAAMAIVSADATDPVSPPPETEALTAARA